MHEIFATRHKIADEFRCIHLFHCVHDVIFLSVLLDSIGAHARLLYGEEWQIIELVVQLHWCFDITLDEESILAECLECCTHPFGSRLIFSITSCRSGTPTNS